MKKHALCPIQIYPYQNKHHSMSNVNCHILYIFYSKIIFFRSSCTYSHRYIPSTPLSSFNLPFVSLSLCTRVSLLFSSVSWEYDLKKHMCLCTTVKFFPYIVKVSFWHFNDTSTVWKWIFVLYPIQRTHVVWKSQLTKTFSPPCVSSHIHYFEKHIWW